MSTSLNNAAERFAQLIDLTNPPLLLDGGDPRMRPALALTAALRSAARETGPAPLSPQARQLMRERLVAAAADRSAAAPMPTIAARVASATDRGQQRAAAAGRRIGRRTSAIVGSVMILTSISGVGVAAARSVPGSPFYDLKRGAEAVQLWFSSGEAAKGQRHLEFARTRLAEAKQLSPDSPYLAATLRAMNEETRQANTELVKAYRTTGSVKPLADLVRFARSQYEDLAKLGAALPKELRDQATYSAQLLAGVGVEVKSLTTGLCAKCGGTHTPAVSPKGGKPIVAPTPTAAGTKPGHRTAPSTQPSRSPKSLLPGNLIPTLPPLTHPKGQQDNNPLPKLSPLPLLSSLAQLLGG
jgi:hypothetical protein